MKDIVNVVRDEASMVQLAIDAGFYAAAVISTEDIVFDASFRPYCEENLCGCYGANYSCPPDLWYARGDGAAHPDI